jgi:hypothetical protein
MSIKRFPAPERAQYHHHHERPEHMRFTKIRIANKEVELAWEERDGETKTTHGLKSPEPPTPEFVGALRGMKRHLPLTSGLPVDVLEGAEVRVVSISSDKNDRRTFTMSAVNPVEASNSPLNINTPPIIETEEVRDGSLFGDVAKIREVFDDFDALAKHAQGFMNGERGEEEKPPRETDPGQTTIEEGISEAQRTEAGKVFLAIMGTKPENQGSSNRLVTNAIIHAFDGVEFIDDSEGRERKIAGLYRHEITDDEGNLVRYDWCRVDTTGDVPKLFYGVDAEKFDIAAATPTLSGFQFVPMLRDAWDLHTNGKGPQKAKPQPGNVTEKDTALAGAGV